MKKLDIYMSLRVLVVGDGKITFNVVKEEFNNTVFIPNLRCENIGHVLRANGYDCLVVDGTHIGAAQLAEWCKTTILPNASRRLIVRDGSNTNIDLAAAKMYGINVANIPGIHNNIVNLVLYYLRNASVADTIVILGHGNIGKEIENFAVDKGIKYRIATKSSNLAELCKFTNFLAVQIPYNAQQKYNPSKHAVNSEVLEGLSNGAHIISISPADVIDFESFVAVASAKDFSMTCCVSKNEITYISAICAKIMHRVKLIDAADLRTPNELEKRGKMIVHTLKQFEHKKELNNILVKAQNSIVLMQPPPQQHEHSKVVHCDSTYYDDKQCIKGQKKKNIVVVGGGIAGLTFVYRLVSRQKTNQKMNVHIYDTKDGCGKGASSSQGRHITVGEGLPFAYSSTWQMRRRFPEGFSTKEFNEYPQETQKFIRLYERDSEMDRMKIKSTKSLQQKMGKRGVDIWRMMFEENFKLKNAAKVYEGCAYRIYEDPNFLGVNRQEFDEVGIEFRDVIVSDVVLKTGITHACLALEMDMMCFDTYAVCQELERILKENYGVIFHYNSYARKLNLDQDGNTQSVIINGETVYSDIFVFATGANTSIFTDVGIYLPVHAVVGTNITIDLPNNNMSVPCHFAKYFSYIGMVNISFIKKPDDNGRTLRLTGGFYIDPDNDINLQSSKNSSSVEQNMIHAKLSSICKMLYPTLWEYAVQHDKITFSSPCYRPASSDGLPIVGPIPSRSSNAFYIGGTSKNGTSIAPVTADIICDYISCYHNDFAIYTSMSRFE